MAVIGTYNGVSILALPDRPGRKQIELGMNDTETPSRSLFTGVTQIQSWPGGDWWDANISLPQMVATDAAVWSAFLAECRGIRNVFYLGDTLRRVPQGSADGLPVIDGVQAAMLTSLNTRGWSANSLRLLLPGDYLQIGTHLHKVLNSVQSDANGKASISIWPSLREATTDAQPIILNNPQGLFRLADNRRTVMSNETLLTAVSLKAVEAR